MSGVPYNEIEGLLILCMVSTIIIMASVLSYLKKIGVEKELLLAAMKGGIQLFIISIILTYIFTSETWYFWIWFLLTGMVLIGGYTSAKRATGMPEAFSVTTPSILSGSVIVLIILAITHAMPLHPQFVIPLAGMTLGNSMNICSLTLERVIREIKLNKDKIEVALSLGATSTDAIEVYNRIAVRAALVPIIDRVKTLGIIFIPGAMAGLLMAGTNPLVAAEYQIIVYLMIMGSGVITSLHAVHLARKKMFTSDEQIADWIISD